MQYAISDYKFEANLQRLELFLCSIEILDTSVIVLQILIHGISFQCFTFDMNKKLLTFMIIYMFKQMQMSVFCFLPANMGAPVLTSMEDTPVCVKMDGLVQTVKWVCSPRIISYCIVYFNAGLMRCHFMKNEEKLFLSNPVIFP